MGKMRVGWLGGVLIETREASLLFDPAEGCAVKRKAHVFISHAHTDHTYGFMLPNTKYSTLETRSIYEALRRRPVRAWIEAAERKRIKVGDVEVVPLNAGHMLGSTQFKVIAPEATFIYTGDLNYVDTLTTAAADGEPCDYLIMEATYGHPSYIFPRREKIYADIIKWAVGEAEGGRIPTFHVYSAGKAQEIVRLFNVYTKLNVVCQEAVSKVNKVYGESGVKLDYICSYTSEAMKALKGNQCAYVATLSSSPPSRASRATATGWAVLPGARGSPSFPLSSHADFKQLIDFAKETGAKKVYAFTGFTDIFTEYLRRKLDVDAEPIPVLAQTKMTDF